MKYRPFGKKLDWEISALGFGAMRLPQNSSNPADVNEAESIRMIRYAASRGLGVVVMEPLQGGSLAKQPPKSVSRIWDEAEHKRSPAEWALLWVWEHPEVSVVLSGMSEFGQIRENLAIVDRSGQGALTPSELKLIAKARAAFKKLRPIPCTGCGYCMPCSHGVEIPRIFEFYNNGIMHEDIKRARFYYQFPIALKESQRADQCKECGECEEACPQKIPVAEWLKKVHAELGPK